MAIRAAAQEPDAANLYGMPVDRIKTLVMGIGCALAAMAGGMMAPVYPVNPFMGRIPLIMSLLTIVIGGLGSLTGAIVGGVSSLVAGPIAGSVLLYDLAAHPRHPAVALRRRGGGCSAFPAQGQRPDRSLAQILEVGLQ